MSGFDDDPIPAPRFASINVVEALSVAQAFPIEAIEIAARAPARLAEPVLRVVEAFGDGQTLTEREWNLLFWGVHVLAEAGDRRLFGPLLRLLRGPEQELEDRLGDVMTETLPRMAISTYDGDWPTFADALRDPELNDFARWQLILAMAYLTWSGLIRRDDAYDFLSGFDRHRTVGGSDHGWFGWEEAIALLGFDDLASRVRTARLDGRLLEDLSSPEDFAATLAEAAASPEDDTRFEARRLHPLGRAVEELDAMLSRYEDEEDDAEPVEPVRNPFRDVGRNDPCPCGSGQKFKKCCLAAESPSR